MQTAFHVDALLCPNGGDLKHSLLVGRKDVGGRAPV